MTWSPSPTQTGPPGGVPRLAPSTALVARRSRPLKARAAVICALLVLTFVAIGRPPDSLRNIVHDIHQEWRRSLLLSSFDGAARVESAHFLLLFDKTLDEPWSRVVLDCAESARTAVTKRLGLSPLPGGEKVPLILHRDRESLDRQFGSRAGFQALGAYWCGVIQTLSPRLWLGPEPDQSSARLLWTGGPLVHEYTHYVLDQVVPGGNYPRWFSEGLAQYVEYKETGYLWLEAGTVRPDLGHGFGYGLDDLTRNFDGLPDTALAYRQAFLLVAYLVDYRVGRDGLNHLLAEMAHGRTFDTALRVVSGMPLEQFESDWVDWLDWALDRYS